MSIHTILKSIGLNDKEVRVYLALFAGGTMTPATLSKRTKINRATVYNIAQSLMSFGIVAEDVSEKKRHFVALPPSALKLILQDPARELKEKELKIDKAIDELSRMTAEKTYAVPKIQFIEEAGVEKFLYANIEKWATSARTIDNVMWGFQDEGILKTYREFFNWYWEQPMSKSLKMYHVGNASLVEKNLMDKISDTSRRDVRFSSDLLFTSSVFVVGDYLVMVVTQQRPRYLVEIHDAMLAHNMREVFKKLWRQMKR